MIYVKLLEKLRKPCNFVKYFNIIFLDVLWVLWLKTILMIQRVRLEILRQKKLCSSNVDIFTKLTLGFFIKKYYIHQDLLSFKCKSNLDYAYHNDFWLMTEENFVICVIPLMYILLRYTLDRMLLSNKVIDSWLLHWITWNTNLQF